MMRELTQEDSGNGLSVWHWTDMDEVEDEMWRDDDVVCHPH